MKYQIYLAKDVSDLVNKVAKYEGKKPNTLIKELLESNFRTAYQQATELETSKNGKTTKRKI